MTKDEAEYREIAVTAIRRFILLKDMGPSSKIREGLENIIDEIRGGPPAPPVINPERPKIVCFCGSSRFIDYFAVFQWEYEKAGKIALGLHLLPANYPTPIPDHLAEVEGVAEQLDELHKRKIDLADEVFILNVGGYIGDSTKSEIRYAIAHGKPVRWLEPDKKWEADT